ncbi:MAG TPA: outer membrane beta-barrel protein [Candidatus Limnocylindria bacterium]|nr:outer membrane beta-barrel protein [Candidatus Limnocylindria bacterium]
MRAFTLLLVLALVTTGSTAARAADDMYARPGGFVGGGFLGVINDSDIDELTGDSLGFELRGGYRFHRHFAVEGQFMYTHNIGGDFGIADVDLETVTGTVNLKGYVLPGRIQPYGVVGIGGTSVHAEADVAGTTVAEDTEAAFTFRGGGGVDLYLTPRVLLYTEASYVLLTGDLDGNGGVPIVFGAQVRF